MSTNQRLHLLSLSLCPQFCLPLCLEYFLISPFFSLALDKSLIQIQIPWLKLNCRLVNITLHQLHITLQRSQVAFLFSVCRQHWLCLSLPPGSAAKGGKSTEAAALLREEASQQRAWDWREGNTVVLFFHRSLSFSCLSGMYKRGCFSLNLICSSLLALHHSHCPALTFPVHCPQPFRHFFFCFLPADSTYMTSCY